MKTPLTVLALAMTCFVGASALAESPARPERGAHMDRLALLLDMNDYQKTEVAKIFKEQHEQMRASREQARDSGTRPSREDLRAAHQQAKENLDTRLAGVLDATQLKKLAALKEMQGPRGGPGKRPGNRGERGSDKRATQPSSEATSR